MLKIWLGDFQKTCIKNPDRYFNLHKEPEWFENPDVKKAIKGIDRVDVIDREYMMAPVFGAMSPERLSTGCKAVILLIINPLCNVYASRCGDNCAKYILNLAKETDVIITLHHAMMFPEDFEGQILDTGEEFKNLREFTDAYIKFKYGE